MSNVDMIIPEKEKARDFPRASIRQCVVRAGDYCPNSQTVAAGTREVLQQQQGLGQQVIGDTGFDLTRWMVKCQIAKGGRESFNEDTCEPP
jgi:hypothetical protein